jgi:hypothetical protein
MLDPDLAVVATFAPYGCKAVAPKQILVQVVALDARFQQGAAAVLPNNSYCLIFLIF